MSNVFDGRLIWQHPQLHKFGERDEGRYWARDGTTVNYMEARQISGSFISKALGFGLEPVHGYVQSGAKYVAGTRAP